MKRKEATVSIRASSFGQRKPRARWSHARGGLARLLSLQSRPHLAHGHLPSQHTTAGLVSILEAPSMSSAVFSGLPGAGARGPKNPRGGPESWLQLSYCINHSGANHFTAVSLYVFLRNEMVFATVLTGVFRSFLFVFVFY